MKGDQDVIEERIRQYKKVEGFDCPKVKRNSGVSCLTPDGACYVFPNIKGTGMSSSEFADFVLEKAGVALLPGTCFGEYGEGYVRLCYTRRPEVIEESCEAMKKHCWRN